MTLRRDSEKAKAWRQRSKPLARGPGPKRKTPLKASNPKRRAEKYKRNYGHRRGWIVEQGCVIAGHPLHRCRGRVVAAHVIARGMGGEKGDLRKQVGLCESAHEEAGEYPGIGRWEGTKRAGFEQRYEIDLLAKAEELAMAADALGFDM